MRSFSLPAGPRRAFALSATAVVAVGLSLGLTGCAGEVPMDPAKDANNPRCADVTVRLPATIGDFEKRTTNAQSTGAWGAPATVLLRCGIESTGPTTQECVAVDGVDWIIDQSRAPLYRFEAYGRSPGLEVIVDSKKASGTEAVQELGAVAKLLPQTRKCSSVSDTLDLSKLQ